MGLACLAASACTTVYLESTPAAAQFERRTFFGLVSVEAHSGASPQPNAVHRIDVTTLGLRVHSGLSLGYLRDVMLSVPADCRLVIFVKSPAQLEQAASVLGHFRKEPSCVTTMQD